MGAVGRADLLPGLEPGERVVTTFDSVKKWTPSMPVACRSPKKEPFQPANGKKAIAAGTGC